MKKLSAIALAILFLTSCQKETIFDNSGNGDLVSAQSALKVRVTRPMKVNFYSTEDTNPSIPPTACTGDLPNFANPGYFIHGQATHMGPLRSSQSRGQDVTCDLRFATAMLNTTVAGQLAADNGDLLFYTGVDAINVLNLLTGHPEIPGTITGVWTITGGTGRFTGATGSFAFTGPVDFLTRTFAFTGEGSITY